jgi:sulfonate transport system permease protein
VRRPDQRVGLDRRGLVRRVVLPGAVPGFLVGLRFALTGSWLIMIVAEQINARSGLGFLINEARSWYRTDIIVMGLAVYGLVGLTADALVRWLERTLLAWRRGFVGT